MAEFPLGHTPTGGGSHPVAVKTSARSMAVCFWLTQAGPSLGHRCWQSGGLLGHSMLDRTNF